MALSSTFCITAFQATIGNDQQVILAFDAQSSRLSLEVALSSSRFVVHRKSFANAEEVVNISGTGTSLTVPNAYKWFTDS